MWISSIKLTSLLTSCIFSDVVEGEEFVSLGSQEVIRLISSDKLTVPSEEKVYECVMTWVNHDQENRAHELPKLMEYVRLPLLSQDYLVQHVEENALIRSNAQCQ